jgi:hypothetical protein
MSKSVSLIRAICAATLLAATPLTHAAALDCADKEVSARGLGFLPSPERSMDAAKTAWLKKATEIYKDATVETAKDPKVMCASQGLYSNCTITAVPCGTKPVAPAPKAN